MLPPRYRIVGYPGLGKAQFDKNIDERISESLEEAEDSFDDKYFEDSRIDFLDAYTIHFASYMERTTAKYLPPKKHTNVSSTSFFAEESISITRGVYIARMRDYKATREVSIQ